jgi:hypothetical protein
VVFDESDATSLHALAQLGLQAPVVAAAVFSQLLRELAAQVIILLHSQICH